MQSKQRLSIAEKVFKVIVRREFGKDQEFIVIADSPSMAEHRIMVKISREGVINVEAYRLFTRDSNG